MTRSELSTQIALRFAMLTRADIDGAVRLLLERLAAAIAAGQRVEIRDFGSFDIRYRAGRIGRNPKTGAIVQVPEKRMVYFKAGKGCHFQKSTARMSEDDCTFWINT